MIPRICFAWLLALAAGSASAQQEIRFWHAMGGALGEELNAFVQRFNESQREFRVVTEHKGSYEDTLIVALAAQREGTGPHLVQVYEVGTALMMAPLTAPAAMPSRTPASSRRPAGPARGAGPSSALPRRRSRGTRASSPQVLRRRASMSPSRRATGTSSFFNRSCP